MSLKFNLSKRYHLFLKMTLKVTLRHKHHKGCSYQVTILTRGSRALSLLNAHLQETLGYLVFSGLYAIHVTVWAIQASMAQLCRTGPVKTPSSSLTNVSPAQRLQPSLSLHVSRAMSPACLQLPAPGQAPRDLIAQ